MVRTDMFQFSNLHCNTGWITRPLVSVIYM
jgi:hypothetical protein